MGLPVGQSLSPCLHQTAGAACGLEVLYRLGEVTADEVVALMNAWRAEGLDGFNLTAPHKAAGARWVDRLDPVATQVGAVNTVVCRGAETVGYNTDVRAFAETVGVAPERAVIFGAGGAARAVVAALLGLGVERIDVVNRSEARAMTLAHDLDPRRVRAHPIAAADDCLRGADMVVNGLPAVANHWVIDRAFAAMAPMGRVLDLGYGPRVESLAAAVAATERHFQDGLEMLARQGVAAFALWTGVRPPLEPVLSALRSAVVD